MSFLEIDLLLLQFETKTVLVPGKIKLRLEFNYKQRKIKSKIDFISSYQKVLGTTIHKNQVVHINRYQRHKRVKGTL